MENSIQVPTPRIGLDSSGHERKCLSQEPQTGLYAGAMTAILAFGTTQQGLLNYKVREPCLSAVHTCDPNTPEVEVGGSGVRGQPQLQQ